MIRLYNTVSRTKEDFKPIQDGKVGLYCCGPTVYNFAHIGNLRTFLFEDILRRTLDYNGYEVNHIMNITDVGHLAGDDGDDTGEDKMLKGARREKKTVWDIAHDYTVAFQNDMKALNFIEPTRMPKATDHIQEMIQLIQKLQENGFTYEAGGNIYFDTEKFERYTEFAQLPPVEDTQARVDKDENKKSQRDFALWFTKSKFDDQEMKWESPWGTGYPGWHIECSAMSMKYLGGNQDITQSETFDIHCGGIDHVTVHHTNEIAQSECVTGKNMANYWMHSEWLLVGAGDKMAKSGDNFITLQTVIDKGYDPMVYRYFVLGAHYRSKLNFTWEALDGAQNALNKVYDFLKKTYDIEVGVVSKDYKSKFVESINDDLNTPQALASMWDVIKSDLSDADKKATLFEFDKILGLNMVEIKLEEITITKELQNLLNQRQQARENKNWELSDQIRDQIREQGYDVEDSSEGQKLVKQ